MSDSIKSSLRQFFQSILHSLRKVTIITISKSPPPKPLNVTRPSPLLQLPVDLIFLISKELGPVDRLALLLTCKSLLHVLPSRKSTPITELERIEFLVRLERDLGHQYALCTSCSILRRITKNETPPRRYCGYLCEGGSFHPLKYWTNGTLRLGYVDARLMANHHWYGGETGVSPEHYSMKEPQIYSNRGVQRSIIVRMKFVGDELMIKATHRVQSETLQQGKPAGHLYCHTLCIHHMLLASWSWGTSAFFSLWPPAVTFRSEGEPQTTRGCYECLSDWDIEFEREKRQDNKIVAVTAQSYHLVGRVLLHSNPTWQALVNLFQPHPQPRSRTRNLRQLYPVGRIATMWKQGHATKRYR